MLENREIEQFRNPRNKDDLCSNSNHDLDSYVKVRRRDYHNNLDNSNIVHVDALEYEVCLICPNSNYNATEKKCSFFPPRDPNVTPTPVPSPTPTPTPGPIQLIDAFSSVLISGNARYTESLAANVITNSDGLMSYQWYYNTQNSMSSGIPIEGATNSTLNVTSDLIGKYVYVKVSIAKSDVYKAAPDAYAITANPIEKALNSVLITNKTFTYDGDSHDTLVTSSNDGTPTITYYSDSSCVTKTTTENATSNGGAPINAETYYAMAIVTGDQFYEVGSADCTKAVVINKATCNAPTNVDISVDGIVTWVASSNCPSATYQVSMSQNDGYVTHTSGSVVADIVSETGNRTLYVKTITPNSNYTDSSPTSTSTTVYSVSLNKGSCSSVTGAANYISGGTATITATRTNPYYFVNWTGSDTYTNISQTLTVDGNKSFTANCDNGCSSGNISCTTTNGNWGSCSVTYKDQTGTRSRTNTTKCTSTKIDNYTCSTSTSSETGNCTGSKQRYTVNCKCKEDGGDYHNTGTYYIGAGSCDSACSVMCARFGNSRGRTYRLNSVLSCSSGASSSTNPCPWGV